jgi:hypothetical protein
MNPQPSVNEIVVLTSGHSFTGQIQLGDKRISDFLNDRRETAIIMTETSIARLDNPGKPIGRHPELVIPKSAIVLAFEAQRDGLDASKRFYSYIRKQTCPVFVSLPGMELRGCVHTTGALELRRLVVTTVQDFIPITSPTVRLLASPRLVLKPQAIIVNLHHIQCIAEAKDQPGEQKETQARQDHPAQPDGRGD